MRDSKRTARSRRHSRRIDVPSSLTLRAYEELGETSELRAGSLQQLRSELATLVEQRVAGWEDLQRALEQCDLWLVRFLRTRKYDSARALHALRGNLSLSRYLEGLPARTGGAKPGAVAAVRFWDLHIEDSSVRYVLDRRLLATVPGRARDGSAVVLLSPSSDFLVAWGRLGVGGFTLAVLKLIEALSLEPRTQLCGITVVVDLRRASSALISTSLRPDMLRLTERLASLLGSKAAFRVRGLWIVGAPWYARALVNLVRTFLSSKLRSRLHLCSAAEDLHAAVEERLLPAGFGAGGGADEGGAEASFEECLLALQRRESSTRTSLRSSSSSEPLVWQRPRHELSPT